MEKVSEVPEEFIGPILPCLDLLENGNINIYAVQKSFWKKYSRLALNVVCLVLYQLGLTMYLGNVFRGELKLEELAYVVSIYVVTMQCKFMIN